MEFKTIREIENILYEECKDFLDMKGPETEEMKACYQAYSAVQAYEMLLYEKEKVRRAATQTDKENNISRL